MTPLSRRRLLTGSGRTAVRPRFPATSEAHWRHAAERGGRPAGRCASLRTGRGLRGLRHRPERRGPAGVRLRGGLRGGPHAGHSRRRADRLHAVRSGAAGGGRPDRGTGGQRLRPPGVPARPAGRPAQGDGPGHPRAERVLRRLRAGRRRPAGRAAVRGALAPRGRAGPPAPAGPGRAGRALRRRGPGGHVGRDRRRYRCLPAHRAQGAGAGGRQPDRPAHGGASAPGRRAGAVHRTAAAALLLRHRRRGAGLDGAAPRRGGHGRAAGGPGAHVPAHLRPPTPCSPRPSSPGPRRW